MIVKEYALGIDIGGTKIAFAIIDKNGQLSHSHTVPSNVHDAEALFQCVVDGINTVLDNSSLSLTELNSIGVGLPGKVDHKNGIAVFQNNIPWKNFPLVERLREQLQIDIPIYIDNDVKAAAFAEYYAANVDKDDIFTYFTISTGIANASIWNHQVIRGSGFSGETGFLPTYQDGKMAKLEDVVGGPAIQRAGQTAYVDATITTKDVFARYAEGDDKAVTIIENCADSLTSAIYSIVCIIDPACIVFGGSVAFHNPSFIELIKTKLARIVHEEQSHIVDNIHVTKIGSHNGVIGAGLMGFYQ